MKRLLLALTLLGSTVPASAIEFAGATEYRLATNEVLASELWLAAESIDLAGEAQDDFLAVAASNSVSGVVQGDLWLLGESIHLQGHAADDARFLAKALAVEGRVDGDLLAVAETVQLGQDSHIGGSSMLIGDHVVASGHLSGPTTVLARQATLGGRMEGRVRVIADDIVVLHGTRIEGNLVYTSGKELFLDESVVLTGELVRQERVKKQPRFAESLLLQMGLLLGGIAVGLPFMALFPRWMGRSVVHLRYSLWRCAVTGMLSFFLLPLLAIVLALTLFGLPLAITLGCSFGLLLYLSKVAVGLTAGGMLLRQRGPQTFGQAFLALVAGLVLLYFLTALPGATGKVAWLAVVASGMGALIRALFSEPERRPLADPPKADGVSATDA